MGDCELNISNSLYVEDKTEYGFQKISFKQYMEDDVNTCISYDNIKIPRRATVDSAGYDFFSVCDFTLNPGEEFKLPTGIRCVIPEGYFLMIVPRSGLGFKYGVRLKNTCGVIDSAYYKSDNEGHIWIKMDYPILSNVNQKPLEVKQGDAICQGILLPFAKFNNEEPVTKIRNGGFGSTSK